MKFYQDDAGDLSHNQLGYLSLNYSVLSSLVEGSGVIPKLMTEGSMQFITSMYSQLPNTLACPLSPIMATKTQPMSPPPALRLAS